MNNAEHSNNKIIAVIAALILSIILLFLLNQAQETPSGTYGTIEKKIARQIEEAKLKSERPDYLPSVVYKNLPAFPRDFYQVDVLAQIGRLTDMVSLEEKYWKQPEFYPTFEDSLGLISNNSGRNFGIGYSAYPENIGVEVSPENNFTVAGFFHSSWGMETYRGMKIDAAFPDASLVPSSNGTPVTINQNPDAVKDYFNVTINPEIFLLEPSSPIFGYNWTVKITAYVEISPNTPKGIYVIGLNPTKPPKAYTQKWLREYPIKYADASDSVIGKPFVRIIADVK